MSQVTGQGSVIFCLSQVCSEEEPSAFDSCHFTFLKLPLKLLKAMMVRML